MPGSICTAEPIEEDETTAVEAAVCPLVTVSPSVKFTVVLFVPAFLNFTNNVSGSVPLFAVWFTIILCS